MPHRTEDDGALRALVLLNRVPGLGPSRIQALRSRFGSLEAAAAAPPAALVEVPGVGVGIAAALAQERETFDPAVEIERARASGIRLLTPDDEGYPPLLREIPSAPPLLYARGGATACAGPVAVVGTRRCTHYGLTQARRLSAALARAGYAVVSGLARGVDTAAHGACLEAGGPTVAVLGCGLDRCYPPENASLLEAVAERGAVLSEFPLGTPPHRTNFPRRNRIISGMSLGVVVVEASVRSGSLITARLAADQGREVFAVPGKIDSSRSSGVHALIKEGAKLVERVEDVLEEIPVLLRPREPAVSAESSAPAPGTDSGGAAAARVLAALGDEPRSIEDVIEASGLPASDVAGALLVLELERRVRQHPGRRFTRA